MAHRWWTGWLAVLAACGGRMQAVAPPAASPSPVAPRSSSPSPSESPAGVSPGGPAAPAPAPTPTPVASPAPVRSDTAPVGGRRIVVDTAGHVTRTAPRKVIADSAGDAAALDSLAGTAPSASLPDIPIDAGVTWDLNVADFADQPRVKYYLDYFTGKAHDRFQIWLQRMAEFEGYAREQFLARKLPGDFVYLGLIESGFSPEAVSRTYAVGMWQFMLGTGRAYGLRVDSWLDERRDPLKSTEAAAHHLDDLTSRFGSFYLAAAAYNAGAGRVQRSLGQLAPGVDIEDDSTGMAGDSVFFSLADTRLIRDETKNYVPQLIAAAILAKEPTRYGFDSITGTVPFSRDSVLVDGGTGLDLIARLADTSLDALHDLNPQLLRMVTPPGGSYEVRVPTGTASQVADAYAALAPADRRAIAVHVVKAGETVTSIARKYAARADAIRAANRSARGRGLKRGTTLYVPLTRSIPVAVLREPDPPRTTRTVVRTVVVRAGETVAKVARRAGVSVATLRSENHLSARATLHPGQRLKVHRTMIVAAKR